MAGVKFSVMCNAVYTSYLEVPDEIANDKAKVVEYLREHISELSVEDLEWISDCEPDTAITEEDIIYIEREDVA